MAATNCITALITIHNFMVASPGNEISHALVDFVKEECIAVVPSNRLSGDFLSMKEGEDVEVLWNNGKKYTAKFLLLGKQVL